MSEPSPGPLRRTALKLPTWPVSPGIFSSPLSHVIPTVIQGVVLIPSYEYGLTWPHLPGSLPTWTGLHWA